VVVGFELGVWVRVVTGVDASERRCRGPSRITLQMWPAIVGPSS